MDESEHATATATWLDLYDYRRRVAEMYRRRAEALRVGQDEADTQARFRAAKDALFAHHPQSALGPDDRAHFTGLRYFAYNPALRQEATLAPETDPADQEMEASGPHTMRFHRAGRVRFTIEGTPLELIVYWIDVYGGGLFLPFRDATCPAESYGGGRYLFDTVKGSDFIPLDAAGAPAPPAAGAATPMGYAGGRILLDFNYAYNPSCAYDPRWVCPLAPNENRLAVAIRAGERKYHEDE